MVTEGIIAAIIATIVQLAQQAGQSVQQWINSPQGQQQIQKIIQQFGPDALSIVLKKLGIKL